VKIPFEPEKVKAQDCSAYRTTQRRIVGGATATPNSAAIDATSRQLSRNRGYHRTQVTITSSENQRLANSEFRRSPRFRIRSLSQSDWKVQQNLVNQRLHDRNNRRHEYLSVLRRHDNTLCRL
jgi:hypothetical protein